MSRPKGVRPAGRHHRYRQVKLADWEYVQDHLDCCEKLLSQKELPSEPKVILLREWLRGMVEWMKERGSG